MEDNTQLVEEILRNTKKADEPGSFSVGQQLAEGTKELPLGVFHLKSAGYVFIYDTLTGEASKINKNMLASKLQQKRPDGSYIFSLKQSVKPTRGTMKCLLHPDSPDRTHYNLLGLAVCKKANLTSPFQVERHMTKRHKQEWATIEKERTDKERQEDRQLQRAILSNMPKGQVISNEPITETGNENEPEKYIAEHPYKSKRKKKK